MAPSCGLCGKAAVLNRAVIKESIPSQHPHGSRIWNLSGLTGWVANGIVQRERDGTSVRITNTSGTPPIESAATQ